MLFASATIDAGASSVKARLDRRRNIQIDYRFGVGDPDLFRKYAAELIALAPEVIVARGSVALAPLLQVTRVVPIVFVAVADPVGSGFVASLARPGRAGRAAIVPRVISPASPSSLMK